MDEGVAKVVMWNAAIWQTVVLDDDAIILRLVLVVRWEGCVAKETLGFDLLELDSVDVQRERVTVTMGGLHITLSLGLWADTGKEIGVVGDANLLHLEVDADGGILLVEDGHLVVDHLRAAMHVRYTPVGSGKTPTARYPAHSCHHP